MKSVGLIFCGILGVFLNINFQILMLCLYLVYQSFPDYKNFELVQNLCYFKPFGWEDGILNILYTMSPTDNEWVAVLGYLRQYSFSNPILRQAVRLGHLEAFCYLSSYQEREQPVREFVPETVPVSVPVSVPETVPELVQDTDSDSSWTDTESVDENEKESESENEDEDEDEDEEIVKRLFENRPKYWEYGVLDILNSAYASDNIWNIVLKLISESDIENPILSEISNLSNDEAFCLISKYKYEHDYRNANFDNPDETQIRDLFENQPECWEYGVLDILNYSYASSSIWQTTLELLSESNIENPVLLKIKDLTPSEAFCVISKNKLEINNLSKDEIWLKCSDTD
jgi:hypothetical protein